MEAVLTAEDYFRVGFLTRCYEQHLSPRQTLGLIAKTAGVDATLRAGWENCLEKQAFKLPWIPGITPQTNPAPAPTPPAASASSGFKMPWIPGITPQTNPQPPASGFGGWANNLQQLWKSMPNEHRWPLALGMLATVTGLGGAMGGSKWGLPLAALGGGAMAYGGYNAWPQIKQHLGGGGQPAATAATAAPAAPAAATGPVGASTALGGLPPGFSQQQVAGLVRPIVDHVMNLPEDQQMAYLSKNVPPQYLQQAHQMLQQWQQGSQFEKNHPYLAPIVRWAGSHGIPGIPNTGTGEPADVQLQAWGVQPHEADYFLKTLGRMRQVQPQGGGIPQVAPTAAG